MSDEAQGQNGTGEATQEFEAPKSFSDALNPTPKSQGPSELGTGFLKGLPPEEAEKFAPYVKQWDAEVNTRFQKIHSDYKSQLSQYEGIDPAVARSAMEFTDMIQSDPNSAIQLIQEAYGLTEAEATQVVQDQIDESTGQEDILDQLPPEIRERLLMTDKLEQAVEMLLQKDQQTQAQIQEAQEQEAFDNMLAGLAEQHGEFDMKTVLRFIASNMDPEEAVQEYHRLIGTATQEKFKAHNAAPTVLGGGNIPVQDVTPAHKLSDKDRKSLVMQRLSQGG